MKRGLPRTIASGKARPTGSRVSPSARVCRAGTSVPLLLLFCLPGLALAQSGDGYQMKRSKVAGGGGTTTGGGYNLRGTMGQHDAGRMSGGGYTLIGGFSVPQCPVASAPQAEMIDTEINAKNRYVSVKAGDAGRSQAIRVRFVDLPAPFDVWELDNPSRDPLVDGPGDYFVGEPFQVCENGGEVLVPCVAGTCSNPPNNACSTDVDCCGAAGPLPRNWFWAAPLKCDTEDAHFMDWHGECDGGTCVGGLLEGDSCATDDDCVDVVHLFHEGFVPDGVYDVQVVDSSCSLQEEGSYSAPLTMTQALWGDICGSGPGGACTGVADGSADVAQDVLGLIDKFQNINALQKSRADLVPGDNGNNNGPDFKVTIAGDALFALDAFQGFPYPFTPGDPCGPG